MKTSILAFGMVMATVCGAGEFLIPAERGVSAADYLEIVRRRESIKEDERLGLTR